jgi:hypothetical protein
MIYGSIGLVAAFAAIGLLVAVRGRGGLRQRFRAEPQVGLLGLVAAYCVASAPSDQLWHLIYGIDLTAWSLPHLLLASGLTTVLLVAAGMQAAVGRMPGLQMPGMRMPGVQMPGMQTPGVRTAGGPLPAILPPGWRAPGLLPGRADWIAIALIACAMLVLLLVGTTEWEGVTLRPAGDDAFSSAFWDRPVWLYPVVLVSIAVFTGAFALHVLRRPGVATVTGLLALAGRVAFLAAFDGWSPEVQMTYTSQALVVPALLALDLWYAARRATAEQAATVAGGNLLAGAVCLAVALPVMRVAMVYPPVDASTAPPMIFMGLLMAFAAGWAGARLGGWLGRMGDEGSG